MTFRLWKLSISTNTLNPGPKRYHFDPIAGLAYIGAPTFATMFTIFPDHRWFLIAAAVSIGAGALRSSFVQSNLPPSSLAEGTPVTNGSPEPVGVVTPTGIQPLAKGEKYNGPTHE